jgi:Tol biopolymer transport system component
MEGGGKKMVKTNPFGALAEVGGALVAVGLLVLMLVVVEVRPTEATFPGNPGRIAHMSDEDGDLEIYTIDPTGGTPVQLTYNTTNKSFPDYSPNGREIAYAANDDTAPFDSEIYKIDATGGTPFQVTNNDTYDDHPSYSPDGRMIAYTTDDGNDSEIYTIPHNGGKPVKLTDNAFSVDRNPSWGSGP